LAIGHSKNLFPQEYLCYAKIILSAFYSSLYYGEGFICEDTLVLDNPHLLPPKEGVAYLTLDLLNQAGLIHAFSTRRGGVSQGCYQSLNLNPAVGDEAEAVKENRRLFCQALGFPLKNLVTMKQSHSDQVVVLNQAPTAPPVGDALITSQPGLALAVQTADCVPVLAADPVNKVVAAVHAGWRGTLANILGKTLQQMISLGAQPENCLIGIGPCIGPCCYQVDKQVIHHFRATKTPWEQFVRSEGKDRWRLDLAGINRWQAEAVGVPAGNIARFDLCTACKEELFFSYRREGQTGRMMSVISLFPGGRGRVKGK